MLHFSTKRVEYRPVGRSILTPGGTVINTREQAQAFTPAAYRTRARIVAAACELIGEGGYEAVTAAALVSRAGISKGGLYHHFDGLTDVIIAAYEQTEFEVYGALALSAPRNLEEYLDEVEKLIFDRLLGSPQNMRIMFELLPKITFDPAFIEKRKVGFQNAVEIMGDKLMDSFGSDVDRRELIAVLKSISVFLSGLAAHSVSFISEAETRELWERFRKTIQQQMSPKPETAVRSA